MQHKPLTKLHRSTVYRRKTKAPASRGRRRVCNEEEAEILGLAAGVIDTINKEGSCPLWKLTKVGRDASTPATLLKGSDETMTKLAALGFPARSILYAVARLHLVGSGGYSEKQIANADSLSTNKRKLKQTVSEYLSAVEAARVERFHGSVKRSEGSTLEVTDNGFSPSEALEAKESGGNALRGSNLNELATNNAFGRSRAPTAVCSVYEYRAAGLDRKMCAYLKKQKHVMKAFLAVRLLFTAPPPLSESETLDRALLQLPKLAARLNSHPDL